MHQDMHYVYEIYKSGSFTKAAERLYISQPALSMAVQKIESNLGMPLFDRSTRPLSLTEAGRIYIDAIEKTSFLEQDTAQRLDDIRNLKHGHITIGGTHYLNSYILSDIITGFHQEFPEITIDLIEESSSRNLEMLRSRDIDLTFSCDPSKLLQFSGFPAFSDEIVLAIPHDDPVNDKFKESSLSASDIIAKRHLSEDCPTTSLSSFKDVDFILLKEGNNLYDRAMTLCKEASFEPKIKIMLSQLVTAFHLAESGYAATFTSDHLIHNPDSKLTFYKIQSDHTFRRFYLIVQKQRYISNAIQAFIEYTQDYFS